jgi:hypothetical protein
VVKHVWDSSQLRLVDRITEDVTQQPEQFPILTIIHFPYERLEEKLGHSPFSDKAGNF